MDTGAGGQEVLRHPGQAGVTRDLLEPDVLAAEDAASARLLRARQLPASGPHRADDAAPVSVHARQLQAVLRLAPLTLLANTINSAVIVATFWANANRWLLVGWAAATIFVAMWGTRARKGLKQREREPRQTASRRETWQAVVHASLLAALWSVLPTALLPSASAAEQLILTTVLIGMMSAGAYALGATPSAGTAWVAILGVATMVGTIRSGFALAWQGTTLLTVYCVIVLASVWSTARMFRARLLAEAEAKRQTEVVGLLLQDFEEITNDALWALDGRGHPCRITPKLVALCGISAAQLSARPLLDLLRRSAADDEGETATDPLDALAHHFAAQTPFRGLLLALRVRGSTAWWSLAGKPLHDADGRHIGWRGVISDVTEAEGASRRLNWLANFDLLTGLANRHQLRSRLAHLLQAAASTGGGGFAVLCLDLDHFKVVNDTLGHAVGDALLGEVGRRLRELTRKDDTVARLGGDEFVVVLNGIGSVPQAERLAGRIVDGLQTPCEVIGTRITARTSIGIAIAGGNDDTIDSLLNHADLALYAAKAAGRGRFCVFTHEMATATRRRLRIEQALRGALERGEMRLAFQPQVDLAAWRVTGMEALLRWRHPELGEISPVEFIGIAEDTGEIHALGAWVLSEACREAAGWPSDLTVSVNVSPVQAMSHDLCSIAERALAESGLAANRLEIEITESTFIKENTLTMSILLALRDAGVRIALDDFGTGYSSLAYLRRFPFDTLKVDRSFVSDIGMRRDLRAIVRMIVALAQTLRMRTVAEGVETEGQADVLRRYGCNEIQGYMVARPMPAGAVADFLRTWGERPPVPAVEQVQTHLLPLTSELH